MVDERINTGKKLFSNLSSSALLEAALANGEAKLAANGALSVNTGARTGRSPRDRFIVEEASIKADIDWGGVNQPIANTSFAALWQRSIDYLKHKAVYHSSLRVGADLTHFLAVDVYTELAWHNLFAHHLFMPINDVDFAAKKPWTIVSVPYFVTNPTRDDCHSDATVIISFEQQRVLICGTQYAGEMKKAMFTVMNYLMPAKNILPMHCAANIGKQGDVSLFFGLSGTGKTTLSADPNRHLIGDDEHGWSAQGVFNFEGGCYAKCINLSREKEPLIWDAISSGAVMENVMLDPLTGQPNYNDDSNTQNTRAAYPRDHIANCVASNTGPHPNAVIFLTCDLFGVLPPVALLNKYQAAYYFLSGYTALIGSTEVGHSAAIQTTFSTCFGAPFFPRPPQQYAELLMQRVTETNSQVYLVNTGWTGGPYGQGGQRFAIPTTRAIISAIQNAAIDPHDTDSLPGFEIQIPRQIANIDISILDPRNSWSDKTNYYATANQLIEKFNTNFLNIVATEEIIQAGPSVFVPEDEYAN